MRLWHLLVTIRGINDKKLFSFNDIVVPLAELTKKLGLTPVAQQAHEFSPQGVTATVILKESHASIHTWPERDTAVIDILSCKPIELSSSQIENSIKNLFNCSQATVKTETINLETNATGPSQLDTNQ